MKTFIKWVNQILANSPEVIKNTKEYKQNVENIKAEITLKYEERLKGEKNALKRMWLHLKKNNEINRAIRELTTPGKLYVTAEQVK